MGRMDIVIDDNVEIEFKKSFENIKKGDISKRIELLIRKDLKQKYLIDEKENKKIKKFVEEIDKMILKFYNCTEISVSGANKISLEWDKLKKKVNKK